MVSSLIYSCSLCPLDIIGLFSDILYDSLKLTYVIRKRTVESLLENNHSHYPKAKEYLLTIQIKLCL